MKWTSEQRYRNLEEASEQEIQELNEKVKNSPWRQKFHIQPTTGLLNDPNGFSYYNGEYHMFYQWFPLGPVHGLKYWYHMSSKNLVHWEDHGIAIKPSHYFDSHGAYSGSALEHKGKLYLLYTGNRRDENWMRNSTQCMVIMDEKKFFSKLDHPVINQIPDGFTEHFRDPKLWKQDNKFYAVIGAQKVNQEGCAVLYSSQDLLAWEFEGEIQTDLDSFGYMWECPDYFVLHDRGILMFSPQGIEPEGYKYRNIFQTGYVIGDKLNVQEKKLNHGEFSELDRGFDFYAPQTMKDTHGRRIMVGWMGLPDIEYPTDPYGWAHCLTLPRELSLSNEKLVQKPIKELELLRRNLTEAKGEIYNEFKMFQGFTGITYELICEFNNVDADELGIEFRKGDQEKTTIKYNDRKGKLILDRTNSGSPVGVSYGTIRECSFNNKNVKFQMFVDVSSVEIFINDGEEIFTSRIFPGEDSIGIRFFALGGKTFFKTMKWDY
ncbi:glycoside hydrolase family 32 protein [Paenibacillus terrae]|uniref:Sucrose-6-phosphate hydrolase n=1 Tax=Paenibacillus terrae TaxID=159743 RepID=A0A0D7X3K9_9BACL|nr:sucrose-6-phosphate hydrolase [Paenibacillus terrae]KJD46015.1 sucrose-6-phosphate hydrolase [Paenibacillus terrae]